jgi:hypothetical protein
MKNITISVFFFSFSYYVGAFTPTSSNIPRVSVAVSETQADLKIIAKELSPVVEFYDPLHLSEHEFWEQSEEASIGFLRHAEIK